MDRYGGDFYRRPMRYGGEYQQWGGMPRYDREFGYRGDRSGRFYDRDVSGYEQGGYGGWRTGPRYDRGFMERGRGYGNQQRYGWQYQQQDPSYRYGMRDSRDYPSPWDESGPGHFRFGLGYGQGRGQFIYK